MRIITGRAKGLRLKTPAGLSTRPTSDRIKESLFSILSGLINFSEVGAVLDIFAGTGALGLESISRGSRSATFIDVATTEIIRDNATRAKFIGECKILRGDFEKILPRLAGQDNKIKRLEDQKIGSDNLSSTFGLIFSDPPYDKGLAQKSLQLIADLNLLSADGLIIIEHGAEEILDTLPNFELVRKIIYGHTTAIEIFERKLLK